MENNNTYEVRHTEFIGEKLFEFVEVYESKTNRLLAIRQRVILDD